MFHIKIEFARTLPRPSESEFPGGGLGKPEGAEAL